MNPFLRYLADKNSAHTQTDRHTDRQTDRHTPMTTRPCGLRRAGKKRKKVTFWDFEKKPVKYIVSYTGHAVVLQPNPERFVQTYKSFRVGVGQEGFSAGLVQKCLVGFLQKLIQGNPVQPMDDTQPTTYCAS